VRDDGRRARHAVVPIPCKPWSLNGLSERLVVSHYEHDYGAAVRTLNAIREELASLDVATASPHRLRALKAEETSAANSVVLHELYFGALGGDGATTFTGSGPGTVMDPGIAEALARSFGSVARWRREFVALAGALRHGSGWAMLTTSRRDGRLSNQISPDHSHGVVDGVPLLVLDMYEHAYHLDFGANAAAYVDAFLRNVDWAVVAERLRGANDGRVPRDAEADDPALPSVAAEELADIAAAQRHVQVVDARPRHYFSRGADMMRGATWHDPDRVDEWSGELDADAPVFVYCAYGYAVGRCVAAALRERGLDARYVRGGLSAWYAAGGDRTLRPPPAG
jgi:superoxide dismutase, Fe-Mn family